jgi:hypothetical protein
MDIPSKMRAGTAKGLTGHMGLSYHAAAEEKPGLAAEEKPWLAVVAY